MTSQEEIEVLWRKIERGVASEQDRVDAAALAGKLHRNSDGSRLVTLLDDSSEQVRWFALQSLVIELGQLSRSLKDVCWRFLDSDPSDDVKSMAAACLGKFLAHEKAPQEFQRLIAGLKAPAQSTQVQGAIYRALFTAAQRPPAEWPGVFAKARPFREQDIDWARVAELENWYRAGARPPN